VPCLDGPFGQAKKKIKMKIGNKKGGEKKKNQKPAHWLDFEYSHVITWLTGG